MAKTALLGIGVSSDRVLGDIKGRSAAAATVRMDWIGAEQFHIRHKSCELCIEWPMRLWQQIAVTRPSLAVSLRITTRGRTSIEKSEVSRCETDRLRPGITSKIKDRDDPCSKSWTAYETANSAWKALL